MEQIAYALKILGHPERLRILALLSRGELTVSELVQILRLSQPRITQYIKSLESAGIIQRMKEGSWVFSRLTRNNAGISALVATTLASLPQDDLALMSDLRRLNDVLKERAIAADRFFAKVANDRSQLGDEYLPQSDIERKMREMVGGGPFDFMVDLGTGTGRVLELFADRINRGAGIDANPEMLKVARHKLSEQDFNHVSVRQGDLNATPLQSGCADLVSLHQVLHYLDDPQASILEASRIMAPSGQLLIVDFEAHEREEFRSLYAHRRLGFSDQDIQTWVEFAGLELQQIDNIPAQSGKPSVKIWCAKKLKKAAIA